VVVRALTRDQFSLTALSSTAAGKPFRFQPHSKQRDLGLDGGTMGQMLARIFILGIHNIALYNSFGN